MPGEAWLKRERTHRELRKKPIPPQSDTPRGVPAYMSFALATVTRACLGVAPMADSTLPKTPLELRRFR
jgi:hypothetical protein